MSTEPGAGHGGEVNRWILSDDMLASADGATFAATVPGPSYLVTADPLDLPGVRIDQRLLCDVSKVKLR